MGNTVYYLTESGFKTITQKIETVIQDIKNQIKRKSVMDIYFILFYLFIYFYRLKKSAETFHKYTIWVTDKHQFWEKNGTSICHNGV